MTDGIIQQAFKKYAQLVEYSNETTDNPIIQKMLEQLQQELIEKIKQIPIKDYFQHYDQFHHSCNSKCNLSIIETLIGDNQE